MYKINSLIFKWICVCLTVSFCLSCTDKAPEYPDLEGYWKQESVGDEATDGIRNVIVCFGHFSSVCPRFGIWVVTVMGRTCVGMIIMKVPQLCVCIISG